MLFVMPYISTTLRSIYHLEYDFLNIYLLLFILIMLDRQNNLSGLQYVFSTHNSCIVTV